MNKREKYIAGLIKAKVLQKDPSAVVILYGSHARGLAHNDSDWDILILVNRPHFSRNQEQEYRDELYDLELEIGEAISVFVFSQIEWESKYLITPLYQNIKKEGIYL